MTTHKDLGLLLLRLSFGLTMLIAHGIPKIGRYPGDMFPDPLGFGSNVSWALAVFAEVICAALLALGLWTRFSLMPLIVTMVVAVFIVHGADPFQKKELGLMYLFAYISLFFTGPGKHSVDYKIKGR